MVRKAKREHLVPVGDLVSFCNKGFYEQSIVGNRGSFSTIVTAFPKFSGKVHASNYFDFWKGLVEAGSLKRSDSFHVIEPGGNRGLLARGILREVKANSVEDKERRKTGFMRSHELGWDDFFKAIKYKLVDLSKFALESAEVKAAFPDKVELIQTTADLLPFKSGLSGVIDSNELFDDMLHRKIRVHLDGSVEEAFRKLSVPESAFDRLVLNKIVPKEFVEGLPVDNSGSRVLNSFSLEKAYDFISKHEQRTGDLYPRRKFFEKLVVGKEVFDEPSKEVSSFLGFCPRSVKGLRDLLKMNEREDFVDVFVPVGAVDHIREAGRIGAKGNLYFSMKDYCMGSEDLISMVSHREDRDLQVGVHPMSKDREPVFKNLTEKNITLYVWSAPLVEALMNSGFDVKYFGLHSGIAAERDPHVGESFLSDLVGSSPGYYDSLRSDDRSNTRWLLGFKGKSEWGPEKHVPLSSDNLNLIPVVEDEFDEKSNVKSRRTYLDRRDDY